MQSHGGSGRYLRSLVAKDRVRWNGGETPVYSVKQTQTARAGAEVLAQFSDDSPAVVRRGFGQGMVYCVGVLPGLSYIHAALDAREAVLTATTEEAEKKSAGAKSLLELSANPWEYPADCRSFLLSPVRDAKVSKPITCNVPLVDAVYMTHERGVLVPLANYTNRPIEKLQLEIEVPRPVARVESAVRGAIPFTKNDGRIQVALPLDNNDFLKLLFE
jgi:hypothetical protein